MRAGRSRPLRRCRSPCVLSGQAARPAWGGSAWRPVPLPPSRRRGSGGTRPVRTRGAAPCRAQGSPRWMRGAWSAAAVLLRNSSWNHRGRPREDRLWDHMLDIAGGDIGWIGESGSSRSTASDAGDAPKRTVRLARARIPRVQDARRAGRTADLTGSRPDKQQTLTDSGPDGPASGHACVRCAPRRSRPTRAERQAPGSATTRRTRPPSRPSAPICRMTLR